MKNLYVTETEPSTSLTKIQELENEIGIKLPESYIKHLLKYNGGRPQKDCYDFKENGEFQSSDVSWFLSISNNPNSSLQNEIMVFKNRIPKELIPIGFDSCGNKVCLGISGQRCNNVYFWDHDMEWDQFTQGGDEPHYDNVYKIASSFEDFINGLYQFDIDVDKVNKQIRIDTHDPYSLPFSNYTEKYGTLVTEFFAKAPPEVEDYVVEEYEANKDVVLYYDVKRENKRYKRIIQADHKIIDSEGAILDQ